MTMFISFLTILAWIMMILSGLLLIIRVHGAMNYTALLQSLDRMRGYEQTFPITTPSIIFIVSLSWIIANWTQ